MKKFALVLVLAVASAACAAAAETIPLPPPQKTGGPEVMTAIDNRASASNRDFPKGELSRQDAATLLWAATGLNRDGSKWTVPMGMGLPPYCKAYFADKSGAYLYDWRNHALVRVASDNIVPHAVTQDFSKNAPALMIIVEDAAAKATIGAPHWRDEFTVLLAGAMSQNVYLASQAVGVGARLVYSVDRDETARRLNLPEGDKPFFAIVLGKK